MLKRDGFLESLWQPSAKFQARKQVIDEHRVFDAVVIGGGITGVTTAYLLQKAGKQCLLLEAANIGFGTTGGTTAHINTLFDATYDDLINDFGEANAQKVAQCGTETVALIQQIVEEHHIHCGFEMCDGYLIAKDEDQVQLLDKIVAATQKVGLSITFTNDQPWPVKGIKTAKISGQAKFNPLQYITAVADAFESSGGMILENCRATEIRKDGDLLHVQTAQMPIVARNVVYATHVPPGVNILHFRNAPYRSYVLAAKLADDFHTPDMLYDLHDPYHYYRFQEWQGAHWLIAGGEDHKTGDTEQTDACFRALEAHVRKHFSISAIPYRWSSQFYIPTDGLPYIGHLPGNPEHIYTATGYSGNGMTWGTAAARILTEIITTGNSAYKDLFNPARVKPVAGFSNFVKEAADVVDHLVGDPFRIPSMEDLSSLAPGEGKVVKVDGRAMGIYKNEEGKIHAVNTACTHIKCTVAWNAAEKSWDCPCHGSRFDVDGKMITGPARKDLQRISTDKI